MLRYASTNNADEETTAISTGQDPTSDGNIKIPMGDMNVKLGVDNTGREVIMGREALGEMNENGELFADFCTFNDLMIGGRVYKHKNIYKASDMDFTRWTH
ncbi:unnamed protein product [Heterobilharzia americana]|nr:unnamed protein product [Heterobilharzia americana]